MARYQVILKYDGTEYFGFQRQAKERNESTVQAVVETALRSIGWQGNSILAAGRTDTGVHAKGQVIAFDFSWRHTPQELMAALNANLPADVAASCVRIVQDNFHPRFDALSRIYQYRIICQPSRDPLRERYAWRVYPSLDLKALQHSAKRLIGIYDFAAFGAPPRTGGATIRQVFLCNWLNQDDELIFEVQANAFLYHMVRRMVGFQVGIGQGRYTIQDLESKLSPEPQDLVKELAPPQGLSLVKVEYPESVV
jgi:tRNA pseudouridine38-40 synthase